MDNVVDIFSDLLIRLRDFGFMAIHYIGEFGYNFFFTSINDLLGTSFDNQLANWTLFEATLVFGILIWVGVAVVRFFV